MGSYAKWVDHKWSRMSANIKLDFFTPFRNRRPFFQCSGCASKRLYVLRIYPNKFRNFFTTNWQRLSKFSATLYRTLSKSLGRYIIWVLKLELYLHRIRVALTEEKSWIKLFFSPHFFKTYYFTKYWKKQWRIFFVLHSWSNYCTIFHSLTVIFN